MARTAPRKQPSYAGDHLECFDRPGSVAYTKTPNAGNRWRGASRRVCDRHRDTDEKQKLSLLNVIRRFIARSKGSSFWAGKTRCVAPLLRDPLAVYQAVFSQPSFVRRRYCTSSYMLLLPFLFDSLYADRF